MDAMNSVSITGGGYTAQISLLGGQLLELTQHEDELIVPSGLTEGAFAGAVLAPWPNRTRGGSYSYHGVEHVLPVNEEATGAALHGLLLDLQLNVISQTDSEVQLAGWLESSEGYPFGLDIALTYRVSADLGLSATLMARYRPEELAEQDSTETQTATAETELELEDEAVPAQEDDPVDAAAPDAAPDAGSDGLSGSGSDDLTGEPESDAQSTGADQSESESAQDETANGETTGGDTPEREADADEPVEHRLTASASAAPDAAIDDAEDADPAEEGAVASDADAADADSSDAGASDVGPPDPEAAPASAAQTAPFGAGFHPYLTAGGAPLNECRLRLPARTLLTTKADGTVTGRKSVSGDFDLTTAPLLAGRTIDHAFTDLPHEGWTAELIHGPSGFVVRMIADSPWVQVYTGERIDRLGVAVEPMSCPPNALNSGEDLIHLEPGEWFRMGFSIEAIRAG